MQKAAAPIVSRCQLYEQNYTAFRTASRPARAKRSQTYAGTGTLRYT
jgi:hypothetical protein